MSSAPSRTPSNAQPALRIPTFDSTKRFSTATDFSDMPSFDFNDTTEEDLLMLPSYLLEQINVGQQVGTRQPKSKEADGRDTSEVPRLDTATSNADLKAGNTPIKPALMSVPARTSSRVPFNQARPVSQLSINDGITALPTLSSRGLLSGHHDMIDNNTRMPPPATPTASSRKRKASVSLSGPIKRLRNLSFDSITSRLHKRRGSSLSCTADIGDISPSEKKGYATSTARLTNDVNGPLSSPTSTSRSPSNTPNLPTTPARHTNNLATAIIPAYPPSSPVPSSLSIHSPTTTIPPVSPALQLLPANNDIACLPALQELVSDLHAENETLKQQVKILREDWYATHDELLVERYKGWETECELWKLRNSMSDEETGIDGKRLGAGDKTGNQKMDGQTFVNGSGGNEGEVGIAR